MTGTLKTANGMQTGTAKAATTATGAAPLTKKLPQPAAEGITDERRRPHGFGTVEPSQHEIDAKRRDKTYEQMTGQKRRPSGFGSE